MSIFKNANEVAYVGGRKHWTDVIKNSGPADMLIWRQPEEDFNTNSTLIVMPGEQAIFIRGGVVEQIFENGTYKLSSDNYPFIGRLRNMMSGGVSTFNCVVYFVKTTHSMEVRWGTDSPIQVRDKLLGIATKVKARGSYRVAISNPVMFLNKLVGNNEVLETAEGLQRYFAYQFQSKVKSVLTKALNETNTELLGIEARLDEFSEEIAPYLSEVFGAYGLTCVKFVIAALDVDDDVLRRRYDEIGMEAIAKMRNAQADRATMDILGDDWARLQAANILGDLANNPGAGGVASAGAGLGMGVAAGGAFGSMAQQMFAPMNPQPVQAPAPQAPSGRFVQEGAVAGANQPAGVQGNAQGGGEDPVETLGKLKRLLDAGLIEQAEYDAKKREVLARM